MVVDRKKDWGYFKGGIDTLSVANSVNLDAAIDDMVSIKQKSGLNKYIDVFTKIGFVLIFISLLLFVSAAIQGILGFGFAVISSPILVQMVSQLSI